MLIFTLQIFHRILDKTSLLLDVFSLQVLVMSLMKMLVLSSSLIVLWDVVSHDSGVWVCVSETVPGVVDIDLETDDDDEVGDELHCVDDDETEVETSHCCDCYETVLMIEMMSIHDEDVCHVLLHHQVHLVCHSVEQICWVVSHL